MTVSLWMPDNLQINGKGIRGAMAMLHGGGSGRRLGGRSGFRPDVGAPLAANSTTWTLQPVSIAIDPAFTTTQGMYFWSTDQVLTGSMTAAHATLSRKDILYLQVDDPAIGDGTGAPSATVKYLAGTAASSPSAPALPARSFLIATFEFVPNAYNALTLNKQYYVAAGAILPVWSAAERDALVAYDGMEVLRLDDNNRFYREMYVSGEWRLPHWPQGAGTGMGAQGNRIADFSGITTLVVVDTWATFTFRANRRYRLVWTGEMQVTATGTTVALGIQTCATTDADALTTGLTLLQRRRFTPGQTAQPEPFHVEFFKNYFTDTTVKMKFTAERLAGSGSTTIKGSSAEPAQWIIEDIGRA